MISRLKDNKAFTIIELIMVVGIIGILVGIASPRFTGFTSKANIARIRSDTKVVENVVEGQLSRNENPLEVEIVLVDELGSFVDEGKLYDIKGLVNDGELIEERSYHKVKLSVVNKSRSRLKGTFYSDDKGKAYYAHDVILSGPDNGGGPNGDSNDGDSEEKDDGEKEDELSQVDREIELKIKAGYIPVSSKEDLYTISETGNGYDATTFSAGTKWESRHVPRLNRKYIQTRDIIFEEPDIFTPIGSLYDEFRGEYDGMEFKISNLKIVNEDLSYSGFFSHTSRAVIKNISLDNVDIRGKENVGGLVGAARGETKIDNSTVSGAVKGSNKVGGLIGYTDNSSSISNTHSSASVTGKGSSGGLVGQANDGATISKSSSSGKITGDGQGVGGLVGYIYMSDVVESFSSADVTNVSGSRTGGLVGYSSTSNTVNSYASGPVTGGREVGGLIGTVYESSVDKSYSSSITNGNGDTGGLVGHSIVTGPMGMSTVTNSYWDTENTGQSVSALGAVGKLTAEMKTKDTYTKNGWDFTDTWKIDLGGYPILQWQN